MRGPGNRLSAGIPEEFSIFSIPVAATVNFMVSRIGLKAPLLLLLDNFGPIHDTLKSTVAVEGMETM